MNNFLTNGTLRQLKKVEWSVLMTKPKVTKVEKYAQDIEKAKVKLDKLIKAKKTEEERVYMAIGKCYVELQQTLDEQLTIEAIEHQLQSEVAEVQNVENEKMLASEKNVSQNDKQPEK